jgi:ribosome maturation factor RimP
MPPATAGTSTAKAREQLRRLLEPLVTDAGYDLEDVTVSPAGRRKLIRVTVDADGGIDLDAVAEVSRIVAGALDDDPTADAVLAGPYVLEVSSPGVDRPLVEPRQWRRALGRLVTTTVAEGSHESEVTGRVLAVDDRAVVLEVGAQRRSFRFDELGRGRVQVEFNRDDGAAVDDETPER